MEMTAGSETTKAQGHITSASTPVASTESCDNVWKRTIAPMPALAMSRVPPSSTKQETGSAEEGPRSPERARERNLEITVHRLLRYRDTIASSYG